MASSESLGMVSYSSYIALFRIVLETKKSEILVKSHKFSYPFVFNALVRGVPIGLLSYRLVWKN